MEGGRRHPLSIDAYRQLVRSYSAITVFLRMPIPGDLNLDDIAYRHILRHAIGPPST